MRQIVLILALALSAMAWAVNGDMGNGDGSEATPYLIEDLADFDHFADPNYAATYWASGVHTKLVTDIDLSGYDGENGYPEFHRIGTSRYSGAYSGIFDGAGHTISNLTLNLPDTSYVGLFGCVEGDSPEVKNIRLINVYILAQNDVGGLIGWNGGIVSNCSSSGSVTGTGSYIGGFIGENSHGSIIDCYSKGNVTGAESYVGGLVGLNEIALINDCYFNGDVEGGNYVGGLVGYNTSQSEVSNSYSAGSVAGGFTVGGFMGENGGGLIFRCYSTGSVAGADNVGGFLGGGGISDRDWWGNPSICFWNRSFNPELTGLPYGDDIPGLEGKTTAEMQTQSTYTAAAAGWDFTTPIWMMLRENEDYPRLAWQEIYTGDIAGLYGVDMMDFAYLGNYWGLDDCNGLDDCGRADIDVSGDVGIGDLAAVAEDWLR